MEKDLEFCNELIEFGNAITISIELVNGRKCFMAYFGNDRTITERDISIFALNVGGMAMLYGMEFDFTDTRIEKLFNRWCAVKEDVEDDLDDTVLIALGHKLLKRGDARRNCIMGG